MEERHEDGMDSVGGRDADGRAHIARRGRLPEISSAGMRRLRAAGRGALDNGPFDGPENMGLYQRCITRGVPNAIFPAVYNANTRIVQGPGFVAITYEMIHETRIIPTTS